MEAVTAFYCYHVDIIDLLEADHTFGFFILHLFSVAEVFALLFV